MGKREQQLQEAKLACRAEKRKTVALWRWLTAGCLASALVLMPISLALRTKADTLSVLGAPKDPQVVYFPAAYQEETAYAQAGAALYERLTRESAVLVKNDSVLPFAKGMELTCVADDTQSAQLLAERLQQRSAGGVEITVIICGGAALTQQQQELLQNEEKLTQTVLVLLGTHAADLLAEQRADGCLWLPCEEDMTAVEAILWGEETPSGRLPMSVGAGVPDHAGIYTDYRFYETKYEDYVTGIVSDYVYGQQVQYPFGYGLSYTSFSADQMWVETQEAGFVVHVKVTNSGNHAGRQVVQIYGQAPYTQYDRENRIEKPAVFLAGFAKTQLLQPGQSQTVAIFVEKQQFASYDAGAEGNYILEAGDYYLCAADNAHSAVNAILTAKGMTPETTEGRMEAAADTRQVFVWNLPQTQTEIFPFVSNIYEPQTEPASISRQDWAEVTGDVAPVLYSGESQTGMPAVTGAQNGVQLWQMAGLAWDDPYWDSLLDQLEPEELEQLAYNNSLFVKPAKQADSLPQGQTLSASFNESLARDLGMWAAQQWQDNGFVYESRLADAVGDSYLLGSLLCAQAEGIQQAGVQVIAQNTQNIGITEQAMRETEQKALQMLLQHGVGLQTEQQAILALAQQWDARGMTLTEGEPYAADLRQAAKRTLYALVNSSAMNGIGPQTQSIAQAWQLQRVSLTVALACVPLAAVSGVFWIAGWRKLRLTQAYLDYQTLKKAIRDEQDNEETAP